MFLVGTLLWFAKALNFVLLLVVILFSFSSRIYEKCLLIFDLTLKTFIRCFFRMRFYSPSVLLPWLQLPTHTAELLGWQISSCHCVCVFSEADYWTHIKSQLSVKCYSIFLIGFASYWKYNYSNVNKRENERIIDAFRLLGAMGGCCMLISLSS